MPPFERLTLEDYMNNMMNQYDYDADLIDDENKSFS